MSTQGFDPNRAQNLPEIEKQMAVKCVEQVRLSLGSYDHTNPILGTNSMVSLRESTPFDAAVDKARR